MSFNVLGGAAEAGLGTWSPREAQGRGSRPDLLVRNPPVRKERGLRLRGPRGAEKTNAACFTDSQAHPVSTGLPPALCAGLLCQDGPLNARVSHQRSPYTTTAFPSEENKTKKQNKMQRFLFSSAEPALQPKHPAITSELLTSLLPPTWVHSSQGTSGWPPQRKAPNSLWGGERGWGSGK